MGITAYVLFFLAGIGFGYAAPTRWKWLPVLFPIALALGAVFIHGLDGAIVDPADHRADRDRGSASSSG